MMYRMTVYVVTDHGGEWEDKWDCPVRAFTSLSMAEDCADKRGRRQKAQGRDEFCDYLWTDVKPLDVIVDREPGAWDGIGWNALRRLVEIGEHVAKGEPVEFLGAVYVPERQGE